MAAIVLYNSSTIAVINIMFQNSPGYAIIGVSVTGESHFENLNVLHDNYIISLHSKQGDLQLAGGIVLIYPKTDMFSNNSDVKLFIKNCNVSNISNNIELQNSENSMISLHQLSVAIGLIFHQQLHYTEIQIHGLIVTNITSVNGPLFLASTHSIKIYALKLSLNGSTFANNNNSLHQLISCSLNTTYPTESQTIFTVSKSTFYNNSTTQILYMDSTTEKSVILVLEGTQFVKNSVTDILVSASRVYIIPIFRNYTVFKYNTANIIFSFSKYIKLDKWATVEIIGNNYNPTQKSFNRFIFEKTNQTSTRCPFQLNRAFSSVRFCNNVGYYRELYGKYLKSNCSWVESLQKEHQDEFETESPEYTYRKTVFNCDREAGLFKWENNLLLCDHIDNFRKVPFDVIHPPVYPGQTITLTLLHLQESVRMYPDFANSNSVFTDILPSCQLDLSKRTIDIVYESCTNLSYRIKSNSTKLSSCLLNVRTATPKNTLYAFRVNISQCPVGFSLDTSNRYMYM